MSRAGDLNKSATSRCWRDAVTESSGAFALPAAASVPGVGLGCSSVATAGPEETSALTPSLAGRAEEVAEEGLAVRWLNHGQGSD